MAYLPLGTPLQIAGTPPSSHASANAYNAAKVLDAVGGVGMARAMAMAAHAVYTAKEVDDEVSQSTPEWPPGWTLLGHAGYGVDPQSMGRQKHTGARFDRLAASLLRRTAGSQRELMLAFRGTVSGEWTTDTNAAHERFYVSQSHRVSGDGWGRQVEKGKTHAGFCHHTNAILFGYAHGQYSLARTIYDLDPATIHVTGHSLGGATAHLAALALRHYFELKGQGRRPRINVLSFAAPRVCNATFPPNKLRQSFGDSELHGVRIVNMLDPVPNVPGVSGAGIRIGLAGFRTGKVGLGGVTGVVTSAFGIAGDALSVLGALGGRWTHPSFGKLRFSDNGNPVGGHPHSMVLYKHVMLDATFRLERDLQDFLF
jgi:hypothetical protein